MWVFKCKVVVFGRYIFLFHPVVFLGIGEYFQDGFADFLFEFQANKCKIIF